MNLEDLSFGKLSVALLLVVLICCLATFGIGYKVGVNVATEHWSGEIERLTSALPYANALTQPEENINLSALDALINKND